MTRGENVTALKSTARRDHILELLDKHAFKMPLGEALHLAREFQTLFDDMMTAAEALAVLSEAVLGYDSNGGFGDKYKDARPAVKLALEHVSYRHGWVTIAPVANGMERLLTEWDRRYEEAHRIA